MRLPLTESVEVYRAIQSLSSSLRAWLWTRLKNGADSVAHSYETASPEPL